MKRSNRLIMLIGVFLAALAFVLVIVFLNGNQSGGGGGGAQATQPPAKLPTVVAAQDIPLGVTVTTSMLTTQTLSTDVRLTGAYGDPSQVAGQVARADIKKGQQITAALFTDLGAATHVDCPAGMTCIAVQVDQLSGVGTLIKTGDYVDVVAQVSPNFPVNYFNKGAQTPSSGDAIAKYDATSVKMLMQGLQVVGTLLPPPPTTATPAGASPAPSQSTTTALNGQQEIVILAVTPQQAEQIKFVQVDGNITLTLRSPKDFVDANNQPIVPPVVKTTGIVLQTMISLYGVLPPTPVIIPAPAAP